MSVPGPAPWRPIATPQIAGTVNGLCEFTPWPEARADKGGKRAAASCPSGLLGAVRTRILGIVRPERGIP